MSPICPEDPSSLWDDGAGFEWVSRAAGQGHVFRVERARGPVWYAKYRLPDGRQVQKKIGPAWTERGRPAGGLLHQAPGRGLAASHARGARRGTLQAWSAGGDVRRRGCRVAALHRARPRAQAIDGRGLPLDRPFASSCRPFGSMPPRVDHDSDDRGVDRGGRACGASTRTKALVLLHGIFQRAEGLRACR